MRIILDFLGCQLGFLLVRPNLKTTVKQEIRTGLRISEAIGRNHIDEAI